MSIDVILYWVAAALIAFGVALTFTPRWFDRSYLFLASGMGVLGISSLWRGWWPEDAYWAAGSFAWGLLITYIAHRKERKHGKSEVGEGQADGELPEGAGDRP